VDDLTARAVARATGRRLILNDDALAHLKERYRAMGRELLRASEKQALLPSKSTLIPNPLGTACGFIVPHKGSFLLFLPGVPVEMKKMLEETVIPFIISRSRQSSLVKTRFLRVFGLSEPQTEELLRGLSRPDDGLTIAYCVDFPEIEVKLRGQGEDEAMLQEALLLMEQQVRERLGDHVVALGEETIDTVVAALFREKGVTLSLAESCTGGLVAKRITDMAGSSAYFLEGAVTYGNAAKTRQLQVPVELLEKEGAVSAAVAMAMARGIRRASGSRHRPGRHRDRRPGWGVGGQTSGHRVRGPGRPFGLHCQAVPVQRQPGQDPRINGLHGHGLAAQASPVTAGR